jgi:hypothetical protein
VWDPRGLPIKLPWFNDGPYAPVEFTRQSEDGRITLVIDPQAEPVPLLWAHMIPTNLQVAKEALRDREGITRKDWASRVGAWQEGEVAPKEIRDLPAWANEHGYEAVIWTALGTKFKDKGDRPTDDQVVTYLRELVGPLRNDAKRYVRYAPRQIDTTYRRRIEAELGWTHQQS